MKIAITRKRKDKTAERFLISLSNNEMLMLSGAVDSYMKLRECAPNSREYVIYTSKSDTSQERILQHIYKKLNNVWRSL